MCKNVFNIVTYLNASWKAALMEKAISSDNEPQQEANRCDELINEIKVSFLSPY